MVIQFKESTLLESNAILNEVCPAGEAWMGLVKKGQTFRIVDLEGNQAVDTLFISAHDANERYSPSQTIVASSQLYLGLGSRLYSNENRHIATITADTCGRHDTLGGACSCESNTVRYAHDKYPMHSCRNNFMYALANHPIAQKAGLTVRHIGANINFFMNVPVTPDGHLRFADGISAAGKYVELQAQIDLIVLISNCPQLNNPCNAYNPTAIRLLVWDTIADSTTPHCGEAA
ncbi:urea amidolyase associated protein UAAP2 [Alkanindiges illinoisensis]|uniref:urea amidolyase associated protein UAAP2 n=1 Tax=Alkanindiges illinoisensis TaxID=197183 RepID=UPI000686FE30|nr:urea amidolyase associated protein UAAP2 [Alkanindiges illinoisensis]